MNTYRALIVDDERLARKELRLLLAEQEKIDVIGEADSVQEALLLIRDLQPDVLFLDIQMPGGTGFDLLDRLEEPLHLIFVTAFDRHAIRAFEVNALDYLLKPVNPKRLAQTILRLAEQTSPPPSPSAFKYDDRICLTVGRRMCFVLIRDLLFIAAADDYSEVYTATGRMILTSRTLRDWEACLPDPHFARIHRSTIVNLEQVTSIQRTENYTYQVWLGGVEEPLQMSRRYATRLKRLFEQAGLQ